MRYTQQANQCGNKSNVPDCYLCLWVIKKQDKYQDKTTDTEHDDLHPFEKFQLRVI